LYLAKQHAMKMYGVAKATQILISAVHVGKRYLHAAVLLPWGRNAPIPKGRELAWAPMPVSTLWTTEKFLAAGGTGNTVS